MRQRASLVEGRYLAGVVADDRILAEGERGPARAGDFD
jgi:hypothetical protein